MPSASWDPHEASPREALRGGISQGPFSKIYKEISAKSPRVETWRGRKGCREPRAGERIEKEKELESESKRKREIPIEPEREREVERTLESESERESEKDTRAREGERERGK
jgi:hypothetical protein